MIVHPMLLAVLACDAAVVVLLSLAAFTQARVVVGWEPGAPTGAQLRLERRAEMASLQGRWAVVVFGLGSVIYGVALAGVLPPVVPGAMCGTGVVQATAGLATRALGLRLLALVLLSAWWLHDQLDRAVPTAPLAVRGARVLLLALPVVGLAVLGTGTSLLSLDTETPVDCCAIVFDQVRSVGEATTLAGFSDAALTWITLGLGALLLGLALVAGGTARAGRVLAGALAVTTVLWVATAAVALVRVFSAYHYGVLHHHCPWCLFLPEHRLVGYPLFGALLVVLLEGLAVFQAARLATTIGELRDHGWARARRGAWRVAAALIVFALVAWVPALVWRARYGVWMSG